MTIRTCQYANCLENIGNDGVRVALKTPTPDGEKLAAYCCASHAAAAIQRLSLDRAELPSDIPRQWRVT